GMGQSVIARTLSSAMQKPSGEILAVLFQSPEDFLNMLLVIIHVLGIDKNVVEVDNNTDVQEISEDGIDEALESSRSVGKSLRDDIPLMRAISGPECSFPLITFSNSYKMVCMAKIELGIDFGLTRGIKKVRNEGKRIAILLGDLVKTSKIHTQT
ncbi:hypothetical protein Moror_9181, partial [Moniliophthora roreri MCA 2997]